MAMNKKLRVYLVLVLLLTVVLGALAYPKESQLLEKVGIDPPAGGLKVRRGLDLQGGAYLVYEAQIPEDAEDPGQALDQAAAVIRQRVNPGGASEAIVQTAQNNRLIVQLPDVNDPEAAKELIGRTAQLEFFEVSQDGGDATQPSLIPTEVSGEDVQRATVDIVPQTNQVVVNLQFKGGESTDQFAELTSRISQNGNLLVTLLDEQVVFGPATVGQPITTGDAQLSGNFTVQSAEQVATLLNAGALPVPIELVAQQTVGPTLGVRSIQASAVAAVIGLLSLTVFMVAFYRLGGVVAMFGLGMYSAALLVVFKLSAFTPYVIVLTLAGIAGFILSIAVAADANILILERTREELASGRMSVRRAVEQGFDNAWSSIRDANIATIISSTILYVLAKQFGEPTIQGFALVLGIGVVLDLLFITTVTKTLLRVLARTRVGERVFTAGKQGGA